jgi:YaiO family outer membrane protein
MAFVNSTTKTNRFPITIVAILLAAAPVGTQAQLDGPVWSRGAPSQSASPSYGAPTGPGFDSGAPAAVPRRAAGFPLPAEASPDVAARQGQLSQALSQVRALQRAEPENVGHRIREARYLSWLARHYTAANRFRAILREHPNHVGALTAYGRELYWQGNWREAQSVFAQAIKLADNKDIAPRVGYIKVLAKIGRASDAYRQAMDLDRSTGQQDPELGMFIADSLGNIGMFSASAGYARRPTNDRDILVRQAVFAAKTGVTGTDRRNRTSLIHQAMRGQDSYDGEVARGDLLLRANALGDAAASYQRAIEMQPEQEDAYLGLAHVSRNAGHQDDALSGYRRAVQVNSESIAGWIGISEMSRFSGKPEAAWQALETANSIAPQSALVYREKLRLAHSQKDADRFHATLDEYRHTQPNDAHVVLWTERWAADRKRPVNDGALQSILDPMAPDLNAQALELLRRNGAASWKTVSSAVPAAPSPLLDQPAQEELSRRIHTLSPDVVNLRIGYEYSDIKDTSNLGADRTDWHEGYVTGYWRQKLGNTFSFDYRVYHRFDSNAQELQGGWSRHLSPRWILGARLGGAFTGSFIPRWRAGAEASFLQNDRLSWNLRYNHLRFADEPVNQFVPGVTWKWNDRFTSTGRLYITHNAPKNDVSNTGVSAYFDLAYAVASHSSAKIFYSFGDENATTLVQELIGDKNFQSAGIELRLGINEHWAVIPSYRFERHNLFDFHAIALALNHQF